METNVNFRNDLILEYLVQLAKAEKTSEFEKFYSSLEGYMVSLVDVTKDAALLSKINEILAFRKKCMGKQL